MPRQLNLFHRIPTSAPTTAPATSARHLLVARLWHAGLTHAAIAKRVGLSAAHVTRICVSLGLYRGKGNRVTPCT